MIGIYQEEINRIKNIYKVTTDENGMVRISYEPQYEDKGYNNFLDCYYNNIHSYSIINVIYRAIYNAIFKKHPVKQEAFPCMECLS
jgi:hypothetical protein